MVIPKIKPKVIPKIKSSNIIDKQEKRIIFTRQVKFLPKLRSIKTSLNNVSLDENVNEILFDAVTRTHQIVIHVYQFIRLYILKQYHDKQVIPEITTDFIAMVIKALMENAKSGRNPKDENLKMFNEFKKFYMTDYKKLGYKKKINGINLSHILDCMEVDIKTNIENNIKMHFMSYVRRFVNSSFKAKHNILLEKSIKGTKTKLRKELNKE